jgi:hypothetical protein
MYHACKHDPALFHALVVVIGGLGVYHLPHKGPQKFKRGGLHVNTMIPNFTSISFDFRILFEHCFQKFYHTQSETFLVFFFCVCGNWESMCWQ